MSLNKFTITQIVLALVMICLAPAGAVADWRDSALTGFINPACDFRIRVDGIDGRATRTSYVTINTITEDRLQSLSAQSLNGSLSSKELGIVMQLATDRYDEFEDLRELLSSTSSTGTLEMYIEIAVNGPQDPRRITAMVDAVGTDFIRVNYNRTQLSFSLRSENVTLQENCPNNKLITSSLVR